MPAPIRLATAADAAGVQAIYAPIVAGTPISFETEVPTVEDMARRIAAVLPHHPWLVCGADGAVDGYAYASRHCERAAYRWSVEVSVYVHARCRGVGVGRALYEALFALLTDQGVCNACAGITLPNPSSVGLHESLGFAPVGVYHRIGYKMGTWHDVGWWEKRLQEGADPPAPLRPYPSP